MIETTKDQAVRVFQETYRDDPRHWCLKSRTKFGRTVVTNGRPIPGAIEITL